MVGDWIPMDQNFFNFMQYFRNLAKIGVFKVFVSPPAKSPRYAISKLNRTDLLDLTATIKYISRA